jgi:hypothetical protein
MTLHEFRDEMNAYWRSVSEEADALKDPYVALDRLRALYGKFDPDERRMADQVIAEWTAGGAEGRRWDALALIETLGIVSAVPALRALANRLAQAAEPGALHWAERATRIADGLAKRSQP